MNITQHISIESINFDNRLLAKLLINIFTLFNVSFAIIVSLIIMVYVFVIYNSRNSSKNSFNVSLILTCNTCLAIICSSTILILVQLSSISGDWNIISLKWIIFWGCHMRGYLLFVFIDSIYLSYVLQAGYRLFRIVFQEYKCLRSVSTFFYYILAQWFLSFLVLIPIFFTGNNLTTSIVYLPKDFYCQVPVTRIYTVAYSVFVMYVLPSCCMCIIYLLIINHIRRDMQHRQSAFTSKLRRQNERDSIIIKRICLVLILLLSLGAPAAVFFVIFIISGHLHWGFYRLGWMIISLSYAFICLSSIYVTPQIYGPIRSLFRSSKRPPNILEDPTSIDDITKTQTKTEHSVLCPLSSANAIELESIERNISHA